VTKPMPTDKPYAPSNFELRVVDTGRESFDLAMQLAFRRASGARCDAWKQDGGTLRLFWHSAAPGSTPLPAPLDWKGAADLAWHWLNAQAPDGRSPTIDGSCSFDAFLVTNGSDVYGIASVSRHWAEYHK
jgi:hypothetical protein